MRHTLLSVLLLLALPATAALQNQLANHPSPYLAMHGEDPVQWQRWGKQVLEKARSENKLIYISSGYFACYWCHVMQRESYQNPEIAALLNNYFIPVKVDRELQPALDAHLITFVERTRGSAGWPLNVFLTPEGYPLVGLTYSRPKPFRGLLEKLQKIWAQRSAELTNTARQASAALNSESPARELPAQIDRESLADGLLKAALALGDDMEGGFGRQNRFPMAPQWAVLLELQASRPDPQLHELLLLTLDQMASQGLRDHLGGGFFRYTIDPGWQQPHFEKMLYTQALLARLYMRAAVVLERPDYLKVARDTLDFTLDVLRGKRGGYIASLSAVDPQGREGGGYLWSSEQLAQLLSPQQLAFARKRWRLQGPAVIEDGYLPVDETPLNMLAAELDIVPGQLAKLELETRERLLQARAPRNHPRDEKQLAAWNGLLLSALVEGAESIDQARYRPAAQALRDFLVGELWDGEQLLRARGPDGAIGNAALEDYVYVASALYDWAQYSDSASDRALAGRLVSEAWRRFHRADGWQKSDDLLIPGIARETVISDGPLPSPAVMLIELTLKMADPELKEQALNALKAGYAEASKQPIWYATQLQALIDN